jgi:RNA polymerase sigma-70 factor (ECF subfamily)
VRGRLTITTGTDGQGEHSPSYGPGEGELLGRLRAGDEEAFACLVDRHHAAMVRFARGYVRSPAVAEEVAQDAWLGLLRGLDRFEGRSSLRTWLFRIVANRAISAGLHERQHLPVDDSELGDDSGRFSQDGWWVTPPAHWADEAVDRMVAPELAVRVRQLVEDLPPAQRQVVTLRDVEGLPTADVCSILGISEGNQRVLLHRARARIRQHLEQEAVW